MDVEISLLGGFHVTVDGLPVPDDRWRRRQAAALVKILSLAPNRRLHREVVIDLLWPELTLDQAGPRLHKAAHYARRALDVADGVVLGDDTVALLPDASVSVDAVEFERRARDAEAANDRDAATEALSSYAGDLLPDDLYEPWCDDGRERLRLLHLSLLRLAGRWEDVIRLDPADEAAHLALMRGHAEAGDRRAALRQFERMTQALHRELGVAPSEDAVRLRDELMAQGVDALSPEPAVTTLVGREDECGVLEQQLARAQAGHGSTVLISGGPGVGKTALADWLRERAEGLGWCTGTGVAAAFEGAWPYAPALEAVADLVRRHPDAAEGLPPELRADIDRVLSGEDLSWTGDTQHQRLFVAVAELVRLATREHGALLVVDDLHDADEGSLRLLHYLARGIRNDRALVVLVHTAPPTGSKIEELRRSLLGRGFATDVVVAPLDDEAAAELVTQQHPDAPPQVVEQIVDVAAGLPLAIVEMSRRSGRAPTSMDDLGESVLAGVAQATREVLQRVAIVGSSFGTDEFVALSNLDEDQAFAQLDAALAARLLVRTDTGFRFRHDLLREALLNGLGEHRRTSIHRITAERLGDLGASPARIGHHLIQAGDLAAAAPYVLRAAETEAAIGAFRDALDLIEPIVHDAPRRIRPRILALRADLLAAVGDPSAIQAYHQALEVAPAGRKALVRARMARAAVMMGQLETAQDALRGLEGDGGPHEGAVVLARGMVSYLTGDLAAADAACDEARSRVGEGMESWQLLDMVALQGLLAHNRGEWFERIRQELQATKDSPDLATTVFDSHLCVAEYLLYGPTPYEEVIQLAFDLRETARRAGALRAVAFAGAIIGEAALLSGDLERAEAELSEAVDAHRDIGAQAGEALCLERLAELRLAQGRDGEARELLRQALVKARWSMLSMHLLQRIYATMISAAESPEEARAVVDQAEATMADEDHCMFCHVMFAVPAAVACARAGDVDEARRHLGLAEMSASMWRGTAWQAAVLEARAAIDVAEGAVKRSREELAEAADLFERAGQPLDAARCRAGLDVAGMPSR